MAKRKIKFTRTELKHQRDALARFKRYLPTLKLKQQQVQASIVQTRQMFRKMQAAVDETKRTISAYEGLFNNVAGLNFKKLAAPDKVKTKIHSIAGVYVPQFENIVFPHADYSLFGTAPWVDRALADLRKLNSRKAELDVLQKCLDLLEAELKKVMQRVNLFEKVMIPNTLENIRRIRIALGDQMTAGVARAKIAKAKLEQKEHADSVEAAAV
ncbi:MAG: V-type ATP synthase subunit D [Sedimentisphaerales bacterium]|nr:V-type ATP synthase subunit D [Sedimentisphaerales bacterium]